VSPKGNFVAAKTDFSKITIWSAVPNDKDPKLQALHFTGCISDLYERSPIAQLDTFATVFAILRF